MKNEIELLPCPFCGGQAKSYCSPVWKHEVRCEDCDIKFVRMSSDDAAEAWNRREKPKPAYDIDAIGATMFVFGDKK
jgi:hypothetical protein